jgi:hypothetical protein
VEANAQDERASIDRNARIDGLPYEIETHEGRVRARVSIGVKSLRVHALRIPAPRAAGLDRPKWMTLAVTTFEREHTETIYSRGW